MSYNAFISYSREADTRNARAMRSALQRFTKPWYRLRALDVFLDESDLAASPGLWSRIEAGLANAGFLILLASPHAARSQWVRREVEYWLTHKSIEHVLIALTSGEIVWNRQTSDFDWKATTSLPDLLRGRFAEEPKYVDMRWATNSSDLSLQHPAFRQSIIDLAAPLHDRLKSDLDGEDIAQFRRTKRAAISAIVGLTGLLILSLSLAYYSNSKRHEAEFNARVATSERLAAHSEAVREQSPQRAVLLAAEAVKTNWSMGEPPTQAAEQALRTALDFYGGERLKGQVGRFGTLIMAPNGRWLAGVGKQNSVLVWDLTKEDEPAVLEGHEGSITQILFSPNSRWLVSSSLDRTVRVWAVRDLRSRPIVLRHGDRVVAATVSPDNGLLATGSEDGYVRIWKLDRVREPPIELSHPSPEDSRGTRERINFVGITPDGKHLISSGGYSAWVRALDDLKRPPFLVRHHALEGVKMSHEGRRLISFSNDEIKIWELEHLGRPPRVLKPQIARIYHLATGQSSSQLAATGGGGQIEIWNLDNPTTKSQVWPKVQTGIKSVSFTPGDRFLVTVSDDKTVALHMRGHDNFHSSSLVLRGHDDGVYSAVFSPDGSQMYTASYDLSIRRWNLNHPVMSPHVLGGATHTVACVAAASRGTRIAAGDLDGNIRVWDTSNLLAPPVILVNQEPVRALAISPDGRYVISGDGYAHEARLWDLRTPEKPKLLFDARGSTFSALAISPDGAWLAMDGGLGEASLWDFRNAANPPTFHSDLEEGTNGIAFSRDGKVLVTISDWTAHVRNLAISTLPFLAKQGSSVLTAVAISPDGHSIAIGDKEGRILLFNSLHNEHDVALQGHRNEIAVLTMSSDARRLMSIERYKDTRMRIWNLDAIRASPIIAYDGLEAAAFSADGRWLIGTGGHYVLLWNNRIDDLLGVAAQTVGRNLSPDEWQQYFGEEPYRQTFPGLIIPSGPSTTE
jgi:WD40 repeat protein